MARYQRTHKCSDLGKQDVTKQVSLSGWVHRRRDHGGLIFIDLRDRFGLTQLVFNPKVNAQAHAQADTLRSEWVINIHGKVLLRSQDMVNPKLKTGEIEIEVHELNILSHAKTPPFSVCDDTIDVNEELRLKYRYLDMRRGPLLDNLLLRDNVCHAARNFLHSQNFVEVSTPLLGKSTPEGARDYLVPSRVHPGSFYALPQSPQLFKQILMVANLDRYYQIATCLRDEDLRANRQPEFTQIDLEMSFETPDTLMMTIEHLLQAIFKQCLKLDLAAPFLRINYHVCMENYGTDKPDLRFDMPLVRLDDIARRSSFSVFKDQLENGACVKGLCVKGGADLSRKDIEDYTSFVGSFGIQGLAWMKHTDGKLTSNIVKFFESDLQDELIAKLNIESGDLIFMVANKEARCNQGLDHLRRKIAADRHLIKEGTYAFLWVTEFPLFCLGNDNHTLESAHHPFTYPHPDDIPLLDSDPLKIRSSSYDIVLNGHELGSGSQRIHDGQIQKKIFEILKISEEDIHDRFGFFIEALQYGTPPHLGIALGLDRLMMVLTHTENIRDVVAFPKTQKASDLMCQSPGIVDGALLADLGLRLQENVLNS